MNNPQELDRDTFLVEVKGVVATVHLHRSAAGWSVHVMTAQDPDGNTIQFGHGAGQFATVDEARNVGTNIARQRIEEARVRGAGGLGFTVRAAAIERAADLGNFDAVLEVLDGADQVTDRHFIKIINNHCQSAEQARETARRSLDRVDGVSDTGKLIF
ncbi:hypothetical protein [Stenotrophomonas chelatiphaga]|uniref:hypothetical protein n=1 Tax=Stenotrophomonas chelatiphaga TaxID=517011 RepID=UPI0028988EFE|nr:hypothetical protein [Stenotrophomonas chelatiphaga]